MSTPTPAPLPAPDRFQERVNACPVAKIVPL